jgi:uncharacterized protein YwgA
MYYIILLDLRESDREMEEIKEKMAQLNEVSRFILLLLRANEAKPIPGPLWLQKEIFLLQEVFPDLAKEVDFEPYLMGPHSGIVANEVQELHASKLIRIDGEKFSLTEIGKAIADDLIQKSDRREIQKIEEFKEFINDLSKDELLAFIYFSYPLDRIEKESFEYKGIVSRRKKLAISLFEKGKISAQRAAQIAGENLEDFIESFKK